MIGISFSRVASSAAFSDTARFGRRGSAANVANAGVMPEVDTVTRRGEHDLEEDLERRDHAVGIEERLPHPHEDDAQAFEAAADVVASTA